MTLAEYVTAVITENRLSAAEVARRSNGLLSESYVLKIMHGETKHPSIPKLKALAKGMGVDEEEVLKMAGIETGSPWPPRKLLTVMQKIVASPELTELVNVAVDKEPVQIRKAIRLLKK